MTDVDIVDPLVDDETDEEVDDSTATEDDEDSALDDDGLPDELPSHPALEDPTRDAEVPENDGEGFEVEK